MSVPNPLNM